MTAVPLTEFELEQIAKRYCELRSRQDGQIHDYKTALEVIKIFDTWRIAFQQVLKI